MSELVVTGTCPYCHAQVVDGDPSCACWDPYDWEPEPVVFGAEELHLLGERYGWDARLGDVIVAETLRRVDLKLESEKAADADTPAAQGEGTSQPTP